MPIINSGAAQCQHMIIFVVDKGTETEHYACHDCGRKATRHAEIRKKYE